jgi:hypothetical protein
VAVGLVCQDRARPCACGQRYACQHNLVLNQCFMFEIQILCNCSERPLSNDARRMMLGKIVGEVINASSPVNKALTFVAVTYPVKMYVNGLIASLLLGFIGNSSRTSVVCLDRHGPLRVAHFDQSCPKWHTVASIVKECRQFCCGG